MSTKFPHIVIATITDPIGPIERGAKYEDPLADTLDAAQLGEVRGGGTQLDAARQIAHIEVELGLADLDRAITLTRDTLLRLGAPTGSVLSFTRDGQALTVDISTGAAAATARPDAHASPNVAYAPNASSYDPAVIRDTAAKILKQYRNLFIDAHQLGPIFPDAYPSELFTWYDDTTDTLASLGFVNLGDLKIVKDASKPEPGAGPFARRFLSHDHAHRVDIFQLQKADKLTWARVMNITTELSDGTFVWTSTSTQHWDTPDHVALEYLSDDTPLTTALAAHTTWLARQLVARPGISTVQMSNLADVLASENRCQAKSAAFRKRQGVPSVAELQRMGSNATLAPLIHAEMHRAVFGGTSGQPSGTSVELPASSWQVTSVSLPRPSSSPMSYEQFVQFALDQGVAQVAKVGSPLNPFLVYDTGKASFFVCVKGEPDPMEIALATIRADNENAESCALVVDSRLLLRDGTKSDAIVVMASRRGAAEGETWAQAYRPKGLLRAFKLLDFREQVATSKNLFGLR